MVAERVSQGHAPYLQALDCFPSPSRTCAQAMAADMPVHMVYIPAYEQNVQALHNERAMLVAGLLAAARVFWGMGRAWVKKKVHGMAGDDTDVDIEEILDTVEKESHNNLKDDSEDSDAGRPIVKKNLGFDQLQLTPPQNLPQQQPPTTTAQSSLVSDELAIQLQKRLDKEHDDQTFNDDIAKAKLLSLEQQKPPRPT